MSQHPQRNRQTEAINKTLLNSLKKQLEGAKNKWVDKLPSMLWAYRTTNSWPTRVIPFALAYDMEVIIPTEIGMSIVRMTMQE